MTKSDLQNLGIETIYDETKSGCYSSSEVGVEGVHKEAGDSNELIVASAEVCDGVPVYNQRL
jgi:hypothetical protein